MSITETLAARINAGEQPDLTAIAIGEQRAADILASTDHVWMCWLNQRELEWQAQRVYWQERAESAERQLEIQFERAEAADASFMGLARDYMHQSLLIVALRGRMVGSSTISLSGDLARKLMNEALAVQNDRAVAAIIQQELSDARH